jgi:hypothetical protein
MAGSSPAMTFPLLAAAVSPNIQGPKAAQACAAAPNPQTIINLGDVQNVTMVAHKSDVKSMPYNAPPRFAHAYDGYSGTFDIVRTSAPLQEFPSMSRHWN